MKHHRPAILHLDGVEWVEKSAYDAAMADLKEKQRSKASHNRYFAEIVNMYHNLPATHAQAPYAASEDAFRKHGLIARGHCDTDVVDVESGDVALAIAPLIAKKARKADGYALVTVRGTLVTCSTPHSQSFKAMGKDVFHKSVSDVEDWAAGILGVQQ